MQKYFPNKILTHLNVQNIDEVSDCIKASIHNLRLDLSTTSDEKSDAFNNIIYTYKCLGCTKTNDIKIADVLYQPMHWKPTDQG